MTHPNRARYAPSKPFKRGLFVHARDPLSSYSNTRRGNRLFHDSTFPLATVAASGTAPDGEATELRVSELSEFGWPLL